MVEADLGKKKKESEYGYLYSVLHDLWLNDAKAEGMIYKILNVPIGARQEYKLNPIL